MLSVISPDGDLLRPQRAVNPLDLVLNVRHGKHTCDSLVLVVAVVTKPVLHQLLVPGLEDPF